MRFVLDTNVLVHAVNSNSPFQTAAKESVENALSTATPFALTWGIIYEFLRVATHPRVFSNPLTSQEALGFVKTLLAHDFVSVLQPTERHVAQLERTLAELSHPAGNLLHDIATAVLMREHGIREIVTADTDFMQFPFLEVFNPLRQGSGKLE